MGRPTLHTRGDRTDGDSLCTTVNDRTPLVSIYLKSEQVLFEYRNTSCTLLCVYWRYVPPYHDTLEVLPSLRKVDLHGKSPFRTSSHPNPIHLLLYFYPHPFPRPVVLTYSTHQFDGVPGGFLSVKHVFRKPSILSFPLNFNQTSLVPHTSISQTWN